jgi:hypothetical protein
MIKRGPREAAIDKAIRPLADGVLALLIELIAVSQEGGEAAVRAALEGPSS